ncbi:Hpt domain-containing protein [Paenibacillus sp. sgz500958]|uniref:Hpt domain-containing protein n=1 Tax=Paenibacillus sp. sgz500958 TaxID=3242475 RepID=UPI0036D42751
MTGQRVEVWLDEDIGELIPGYLEHRKEDLLSITDALVKRDFESIQRIGHSMKGSGGGYGLRSISDIGRSLEESAALQDLERIQICRYQLQNYLQNLVVYIKPSER